MKSRLSTNKRNSLPLGYPCVWSVLLEYSFTRAMKYECWPQTCKWTQQQNTKSPHFYEFMKAKLLNTQALYSFFKSHTYTFISFFAVGWVTGEATHTPELGRGVQYRRFPPGQTYLWPTYSQAQRPIVPRGVQPTKEALDWWRKCFALFLLSPLAVRSVKLSPFFGLVFVHESFCPCISIWLAWAVILKLEWMDLKIIWPIMRCFFYIKESHLCYKWCGKT